MNRVAESIITVVLMFTLGGCANGNKPGFPAQTIDQKQAIATIESKFDLTELMTQYYDATSDDDKRDIRDKIISSRLTLINLRYNQFVADASFNRQIMDFSADIANLGVSLAGTAVGAAGTKTILSAISAGITGSQASLHKNFYFEKTVSALTSTMNANRKVALVPILQGQKRSVDDYPLGQALSDLDDYYFAGSFLGALNAILVSAGDTESAANEQLRSVRFFEDEPAVRIKRWIWPDFPDRSTTNPANVQALRDWLARDENKVGDEVLPIQRLLDGADLAAMRNRAIGALNIP